MKHTLRSYLPQKPRRRWYLAGFSFYLLFFSAAGFGPLVYAQQGPYHGRVIDKESKQRIEGAAVLAVWWQACPGIAHPMESVYDEQETVTDQSGNFTIPGIAGKRVQPLARMKQPVFTIFKPGYEAYRGWTLNPKLAPLGAEGIPVVELRPLKTREERTRNLDSLLPSPCRPDDISQFCVHAEKYPNLIQRFNEERLNLGLKPVSVPKGPRSPFGSFKPKVIPRSQLGNKIEDGIGFGGILLGSTEADLLKKWGLTEAIQAPQGYNHHYVLDSGEGIIVSIKNSEIIGIVFWPTCDLSPPSQVKTARGVSLLDSSEKVTMAYGTPDSGKYGMVLYISQGIGFLQGGGLVGWIMVYPRGKPPDSWR